ncbi:kinase-like domain-containing protein [Nemania serpens]|nr:kinase-like domain-containing protein [Nemania serpens]
MDDRRRQYRQDASDKFFKYRRGIGRGIFSRPLPLRGPPPVVDMPGLRQTAYPYLNKASEKFNNIDEIHDRRLVEEKNMRAWDNLQFLKDYFAQTRRVKYRKCLGWGGNGLAAAFDSVDDQGNPTGPVVVKMIFSHSRRAMKQETDMCRYLKAEHITQIKYIDGEGMIDPNEDSRDDVQNAENEGANREDDPGSGQGSRALFITEMLENGDLSQLISAVRQHKERISNAILWRFCLCLIRMCLGLAYPPASFEENKNDASLVNETIHPEHEPRRIVHFDFDPKNIFVGQVLPGTEEHNISPILKLGDFGLATDIQTGREDSYYEGFRHLAKQYFFAPEQFCADWDYIPLDEGRVKNHPIAGNYGVHTNIWAIGSTMECLITHAWPAWPPKPTNTTIVPPDGKEQYYTYAGHLWQPFYEYVDRDMIGIIMRMQAHFPADRPTLQQLEKYVLNKMRNLGTGDRTEGELQQWLQKILYEPPPPGEEVVQMDQVEKQIIGIFNAGQPARDPVAPQQRQGFRVRWRGGGQAGNNRGNQEAPQDGGGGSNNNWGGFQGRGRGRGRGRGGRGQG